MSLKARIEADWSKLVGFVKGVEFKFFGGKLHQQATHPLTGETAWVPVADGDQEQKEAEEKAKLTPAQPVTPEGPATASSPAFTPVVAESAAPGAPAAGVGTATST